MASGIQRSRPKLGEVLVRRKLACGSARNGFIRLTLGHPRRVKAGLWECAFSVTGIENKILKTVIGVDALHALYIALRGMYISCSELHVEMTWTHGAKGDSGVYDILYSGLSAAYDKKLSRVVASERHKFLQELGVFAKKKAKPSKNSG